ncbi:hypothetical protein FRC08_003860 [Ceratobasidium sp. 394]|nr:hypothetical protein FRC08_003860 [Ceratobasidium sp. 394]KAG9082849.1 hypothetical protein FS749_006526 [Ceratobasidium sp. UAMH 11750]
MQNSLAELVNPCLNCRQRNVRCDGAEPVCNVCIRSGLLCQGYRDDVPSRGFSVSPVSPLISPFSGPGFTTGPPPMIQRVLSTIISNPVWLTSDPPGSASFFNSQTFDKSDPTPTKEDEEILALARRHFAIVPSTRPSVGTLQCFPTQKFWSNLTLDPGIVSNTLPFIISQYVRLLNLIAFRSPPSYLQDGLKMRAKTSNIIHSSMFLGANIIQALLDNFDRTDWDAFTRRIDRLRYQIDANPSQNSGLSEMENRLTGMIDLASLKFITADNASGYSLMKHAAPVFQQVARFYPVIWTRLGAISLPRAINLPNPEIGHFVWMDTIAAFIFGTRPLVHYDTTSESIKLGNRQFEWIYGCPEEFVVLLGRINAGRSSFGFKQSGSPANAWLNLETEIKDWIPFVDQSSESCISIVRLAVHECWRHVSFIYLYMGICGVNSADPRIDRSVRQIVQLLSTVKHRDSIDRHLFVPCLIAGIAARLEKQRSLVRKRIASFSAVKIWVLQGADFKSVLDHLWHGAAKGGRPVVWNDYVISRRAVLPIDE